MIISRGFMSGNNIAQNEQVKEQHTSVITNKALDALESLLVKNGYIARNILQDAAQFYHERQEGNTLKSMFTALKVLLEFCAFAIMHPIHTFELIKLGKTLSDPNNTKEFLSSEKTQKILQEFLSDAKNKDAVDNIANLFSGLGQDTKEALKDGGFALLSILANAQNFGKFMNIAKDSVAGKLDPMARAEDVLEMMKDDKEMTAFLKKHNARIGQFIVDTAKGDGTKEMLKKFGLDVDFGADGKRDVLLQHAGAFVKDPGELHEFVRRLNKEGLFSWAAQGVKIINSDTKLKEHVQNHPESITNIAKAVSTEVFGVSEAMKKFHCDPEIMDVITPTLKDTEKAQAILDGLNSGKIDEVAHNTLEVLKDNKDLSKFFSEKGQHFVPLTAAIISMPTTSEPMQKIQRYCAGDDHQNAIDEIIKCFAQEDEVKKGILTKHQDTLVPLFSHIARRHAYAEENAELLKTNNQKPENIIQDDLGFILSLKDNAKYIALIEAFNTSILKKQTESTNPEQKKIEPQDKIKDFLKYAQKTLEGNAELRSTLATYDKSLETKLNKLASPIASISQEILGNQEVTKKLSNALSKYKETPKMAALGATCASTLFNSPQVIHSITSNLDDFKGIAAEFSPQINESIDKFKAREIVDIVLANPQMLSPFILLTMNISENPEISEAVQNATSNMTPESMVKLVELAFSEISQNPLIQKDISKNAENYSTITKLALDSNPIIQEVFNNLDPAKLFAFMGDSPKSFVNLMNPLGEMAKLYETYQNPSNDQEKKEALQKLIFKTADLLDIIQKDQKMMEFVRENKSNIKQIIVEFVPSADIADTTITQALENPGNFSNTLRTVGEGGLSYAKLLVDPNVWSAIGNTVSMRVGKAFLGNYININVGDEELLKVVKDSFNSGVDGKDIRKTLGENIQKANLGTKNAIKDIQKISFNGATQEWAQIRYGIQDLELSKINLQNTEFNGASLNNVKFTEGSLDKITFKNNKGNNLSLVAQLNGVVFENSDIPHINCSGAVVNDLQFKGGKLSELDLSNSTVKSIKLEGTEITEQVVNSLSTAQKSQGAKIETTNLKLTGEYKSLDFSGMNMKGADFSKMKLADDAVLDLTGTELEGATIPMEFLKRAKGLNPEKLKSVKDENYNDISKDVILEIIDNQRNKALQAIVTNVQNKVTNDETEFEKDYAKIEPKNNLYDVDLQSSINKLPDRVKNIINSAVHANHREIEQEKLEFAPQVGAWLESAYPKELSDSQYYIYALEKAVQKSASAPSELDTNIQHATAAVMIANEVAGRLFPGDDTQIKYKMHMINFLENLASNDAKIAEQFSQIFTEYKGEIKASEKLSDVCDLLETEYGKLVQTAIIYRTQYIPDLALDDNLAEKLSTALTLGKGNIVIIDQLADQVAEQLFQTGKDSTRSKDKSMIADHLKGIFANMLNDPQLQKQHKTLGDVNIENLIGRVTFGIMGRVQNKSGLAELYYDQTKYTKSGMLSGGIYLPPEALNNEFTQKVSDYIVSNVKKEEPVLAHHTKDERISHNTKEEKAVVGHYTEEEVMRKHNDHATVRHH